LENVVQAVGEGRYLHHSVRLFLARESFSGSSAFVTVGRQAGRRSHLVDAEMEVAPLTRGHALIFAEVLQLLVRLLREAATTALKTVDALLKTSPLQGEPALFLLEACQVPLLLRHSAVLIPSGYPSETQRSTPRGL
jgi:hypothetical protein